MRVLVDMDGVLADFEQGFLNAWRARHPDKPYIPIEARRGFYILDQYPRDLQPLIKAIQYAPGFIRTLPPIPGAIEAMNAMVEAGVEVFICSTPFTHYDPCVLEKYQWVDEHLGREWIRRLILTGDKTLVQGDVLIDDRSTIAGTADPSWEHVIFDQPYNRDQRNKRRLRDWQDWEKVIIRGDPRPSVS